MAPRTFYRRKPVRKYRKRRAVAKRTKTSRTFANKVKKIVHRMAENKTITQDAANDSITPCDGVTAVPYFLNLLPPITIGSSSGERIGNQIRIVKNHIVGFINMLPYNSATNKLSCPIIVKMWVVSWKYATGQFAQPALVDFTTFFQRGSATAGFIGNPLDMVRDVNTDVWTVHKTKTFELSSGPAFQSALNYSPVSYQNPSGVFSHKYSFNLGKYAKLLKYNDNIVPNRPTNKNLYLVIQTVRADGASVAAGDVYCENHFQSTIYYEDM